MESEGSSKVEVLEETQHDAGQDNNVIKEQKQEVLTPVEPKTDVNSERVLKLLNDNTKYLTMGNDHLIITMVKMLNKEANMVHMIPVIAYKNDARLLPIVRFINNGADWEAEVNCKKFFNNSVNTIELVALMNRVYNVLSENI